MTNKNGDAVHFAFPFARGADGKVKVDVQDSQDHIFTQVQVVARYPKGYRLDHPDFGITFPEFTNVPVDGARIAAEIEAQVPDADLTVEEYAAVGAEATRFVDLEVSEK